METGTIIFTRTNTKEKAFLVFKAACSQDFLIKGEKWRYEEAWRNRAAYLEGPRGEKLPSSEFLITIDTIPKAETGMFCNLHLWSDIEPFEIVQVTKSYKTLTLRPMKTELVPSWKPEAVPGGFSGHTVNNHTQEWKYSSLPGAETFKVRWSPKKRHYVRGSSRFHLSLNPCKFYDYNF